MPKNFPRAPPPVLAATLAPCAWAWGAPDLFDSYSAGMILMQVGRLGGGVHCFCGWMQVWVCGFVCWRGAEEATHPQRSAPGCATSAHPSPAPTPPQRPPALQLSIPQLRPGASQRSFNAELANCGYDLNRWRR